MNFFARRLFIAAACLTLAVAHSAVGLAADTASPTAEPKPSIEPRTLSNIRQLTSGYTKAGEGYFSPEGRTIIYQAIADPYPFYQIYSQSLAGGKAKLLSTGRGKTTCSFFCPDGHGILYASSHLDPQISIATEDAEPQASGRRRQERQASPLPVGLRSQHGDFFRRPRWQESPSTDLLEGLRRRMFLLGRRPADRCPGDRGGNPNIYTMNADGSNVRQITHAAGYNGGPFFSPDGRWIVFRSDRKKEGYLQLYVIRPDGTGETALTDNGGVNWAPYWHPHQPYIIWTAANYSDPRAAPNFDLWLMKYDDRDGHIVPGKITRITDDPSADVLPVFSPDGKQLMWTSNRAADHSSQLFIADFKLPEE